MTADDARSILADLRRMINEYHWRWGLVTSIINRRYDKHYTTRELQRLLAKTKK